MKTHKNPHGFRGFTLMELMVAMAITTIIITILVTITSLSMDTWNRSRTETRAARQAKTMVDTMAHDLESLVARRGNNFDWLFAKAADAIGPADAQNTNAAELYFFTAAQDRYEGMLGDQRADKGGDVSSVAYRLAYRNPIGANQDNDSLATFVLYRKLVDPDDTYRRLLGREDLEQTWKTYERTIVEARNFVCENIYQFSLTFNVAVEVTTENITRTQVVPVTISNSPGSLEIREFRINGIGLLAPNFGGSRNVTADQFQAGKVISVEISLSVLSDNGLEQMRRRKLSGDAKADFLTKNSYQYTKLVQLPRL
ncbi:MAG: prepilin-type N-terminal cleavage/methylation domain-containing protein [Luteolibacter sp.]